LTVIDVKIFPLFDSITESFGEKQGKLGLTEFSRVWAYNPWWYRKYAGEQSQTDRGLYEAAEERARRVRAGLWQDPKPVPPWDWRRRKR
jgi:hypothetical protein